MLAVIAVIGNIPLFLFNRSIITLRIYRLCRISTTVMIYFIPLIIIFVLAVFVIYELKRNDRTLGASSVSTGARQGERNITLAMIVTIMAYVLFVFPANIFIFIELINKKISALSQTLYLTFHALRLLHYINYSVNIFIYTLFMPKFRCTLFGFFKCNCCKRAKNECVRIQTVQFR